MHRYNSWDRRRMPSFRLLLLETQINVDTRMPIVVTACCDFRRPEVRRIGNARKEDPDDFEDRSIHHRADTSCASERNAHAKKEAKRRSKVRCAQNFREIEESLSLNSSRSRGPLRESRSRLNDPMNNGKRWHEERERNYNVTCSWNFKSREQPAQTKRSASNETLAERIPLVPETAKLSL